MKENGAEGIGKERFYEPNSPKGCGVHFYRIGQEGRGVEWKGLDWIYGKENPKGFFAHHTKI